MSHSASRPPAPPTELRAPLPADVVPSLTWGPFCYRRYPVFSLPWLKWRTVLATVLISGYAALSALGYLLLRAPWVDIAAMVGYFVAGGVLMVTGGPALATWLRHRRLSARAEAAGIIVSVVVGFGVACAADYWASNGIMRHTPKEAAAMETGKPSSIDKSIMALFVVGSFFLHTAISGGVASLSYFSERRRLRVRAMQRAALDTDMKLAVLQAQIEPHFLFNTLASIRPLIRQDAAAAESALDALSDHLRATIPQMRSGGSGVMSTLGQQLDICASYLAVMKVRMGARLHHEIEVAENLRSQDFPPLILLSLVENAIKHGIEPKPGPGRIMVHAAISGTDLQVSVLDDGQGLKDGLSSGLGLSNIREQLLVRYGGRARLAVAARPEGGTVAEIMIPANP
jgi:hypothetical protein